MKIEYLKEFVTLARCLSYSAAAEQLYVSQPVLSRHIAYLEEEAGAKLFRRNTQSVALTNAGEYFKEACEKILQLYDNACIETRLRDQGYESSLRVGIPYYSANDYLGPFPKLFREEYPAIKLILSACEPDKCMSALLQDELDAILIVNMRYPNSDKLIFYDLYKEPLILLVNVKSPLANKDSVTIQDLRDETFMNISGVYRQTVWSLLKEMCRRAGFTPKESPVLHGQTESALIALQQQNEVLLTGKDMSTLQFRNVKSVKLEDETDFRYVSLVCKKNNSHPGIAHFVRCFRKHVGEMGWEINGVKRETFF